MIAVVGRPRAVREEEALESEHTTHNTQYLGGGIRGVLVLVLHATHNHP